MSIIYGTLNDDNHIIESNNDVIFEGANGGIDTVNSRISYTLGDNIENLTLLGSKTKTITLQTGEKAVLYGNALEWGNNLDYYQGDNYQNFWSDCGIVSCENVLIQAGVFNLKSGYDNYAGYYDCLESYLVDHAIVNNLCDASSPIPYYNGGMYLSDGEQILENHGISASVDEHVSLEKLAQYIKEDKCVIAAVDAYVLWGYTRSFREMNHAITVTGVVYDINNSDVIKGFYICDSAGQERSEASRFISYSLMQKSFYYGYNSGAVIVTDDSVKNYLDNINAIGNDLDNYITGNSGNNIITGENGNDTLLGGAGKDTLYGGNGDDVLFGGYGYDTLYGGLGNDFYYINSYQDTIVEYSYQGVDTVIANVSYALSGYLENLELIGSYAINGYGTGFHNYILGNEGNNKLYGYGGNDTLSGGSGFDFLYGGIGNDSYLFNLGDEYAYINDIKGIDGIEFGDNIAKEDLIFTRQSRNLVINVQNSEDTLVIGNYFYNQAYRVEKFIFSDDSIMNNTDITILKEGNSYSNKLIGLNLSDEVYGYSGNDYISTGYGNDIINGGLGNDKLYGGRGNDTYNFALGNGRDTIYDTRGSDTVYLDNTVEKNDIAIFMQKSNLIIDYGNFVYQDQVTVLKQRYSAYAVEKVQLNDGTFLTNNDINKIIQSMTAYATNNGIKLSSIETVKNNQDLMNIISNSWHS